MLDTSLLDAQITQAYSDIFKADLLEEVDTLIKQKVSIEKLLFAIHKAQREYNNSLQALQNLLS